MNSSLFEVNSVTNSLRHYWRKNTLGSEYTLHQLAPYIGKIKSSIAKGLVINFTKIGDTVYDPYCGACTIPLEACVLGRNVIANDLNPYAYLLARSKLFPPGKLEDVLVRLQEYKQKVEEQKKKIDLRKVPNWVRKFFHKETLREAIALSIILKENGEWFILACLLGILHHQRPGFLSFPSSHSVPYLRVKKFPLKEFPELYSYRSVFERLESKVRRSFKRMPHIDEQVIRDCTNVDATLQKGKRNIDVIITSPPYMRSLDYGRDNRLRLWFLKFDDWRELDKTISPKEKDFLKAIRTNLQRWKSMLSDSGKCILILGDTFCSSYNLDLPTTIEKIATHEIGGYDVLFKMRNVIPSKRRVRRQLQGNKYETIIVLEKKKYARI